MAGLPRQNPFQNFGSGLNSTSALDENRRLLESPLIRQGLQDSSLDSSLSNAPEPSFSRAYRELRGASDLSFMLLVHNCCMGPLENVLPLLHPSGFSQQRQLIKEKISEEKILQNQTRPERKSEFESFSQGIFQKNKARLLSSNYLFYGISQNDLLLYIFCHYKLLGSKFFDLLDMYYKSNI